MDKIVLYVLACVVLCVAFVVLALIGALPTMWLWNAIIPDVTKQALTPLTFWQAFGMNLLCSILFKSSSSSSEKSK